VRPGPAMAFFAASLAPPRRQLHGPSSGRRGSDDAKGSRVLMSPHPLAEVGLTSKGHIQ